MSKPRSEFKLQFADKCERSKAFVSTQNKFDVEVFAPLALVENGKLKFEL